MCTPYCTPYYSPHYTSDPRRVRHADDWWVPHVVLSVFVPMLAIAAGVMHHNGMLLGLGHDIARVLVMAFIGVITVSIIDGTVMDAARAGSVGAQRYYRWFLVRWPVRLIAGAVTGFLAVEAAVLGWHVFVALVSIAFRLLVTLIVVGIPVAIIVAIFSGGGKTPPDPPSRGAPYKSDYQKLMEKHNWPAPGPNGKY